MEECTAPKSHFATNGSVLKAQVLSEEVLRVAEVPGLVNIVQEGFRFLRQLRCCRNHRKKEEGKEEEGKDKSHVVPSLHKRPKAEVGRQQRDSDECAEKQSFV